MARYFLSPHRVARYYFHECDRYLRYTATPKGRRGEEGVPPNELDHSLLTKAILGSGYAWETQVLAKYLGDAVVMAEAPAGNPGALPTERVHSVAGTLAALRNARAGQYLYQPTLLPTAGFSAAYGLDPDLVEFSECRPDLLMVEAGAAGRLRLTVLDLKATDEAKLSHRIQAVLYSLILRHALVDNGLSGLDVADRGGIWPTARRRPSSSTWPRSGRRWRRSSSTTCSRSCGSRRARRSGTSTSAASGATTTSTAGTRRWRPMT